MGKRRIDWEQVGARKADGAPASPWTLGRVCGVVVLLCLAAVLGMQFIGKPDKQTVGAKAEPALEIDHSILPGQIARRFVESTSPEERMKWIRDPRGTTTAADPLLRERIIKPLRPVGTREVDGVSLVAFVAKMESGGHRLICTVDSETGPRVDWDCFTRRCSADWQDILTGKASAAEIRVFAMRTNYYAFGFADESRWVCYQLHSPDIDHNIYGYAKRGSELEAQLTDYVAKARRPGVRTFLRISARDDSFEQHQFAIDRVIALGWVKLD